GLPVETGFPGIRPRPDARAGPEGPGGDVDTGGAGGVPGLRADRAPARLDAIESARGPATNRLGRAWMTTSATSSGGAPTGCANPVGRPGPGPAPPWRPPTSPPRRRGAQPERSILPLLAPPCTSQKGSPPPAPAPFPRHLPRLYDPRRD